MKKLLPFSLILVLLLQTAAVMAQSKRSLLKPPAGYRGFAVDGERYVVGEIYLKQFSDTTGLKELGFRDFEGIGSNAWHKKVKAIWPLDTDVDALPEFVEGLNYEKARNAVQAAEAYGSDYVLYSGANCDMSTSSRPSYIRSPNFSMNANGKPGFRKKPRDPESRNFYTTYGPTYGSKLTMTPIGQRSINSYRRPLRCSSGSCR
jgi:hypothetical protein